MFGSDSKTDVDERDERATRVYQVRRTSHRRRRLNRLGWVYLVECRPTWESRESLMKDGFSKRVERIDLVEERRRIPRKLHAVLESVCTEVGEDPFQKPRTHCGLAWKARSYSGRQQSSHAERFGLAEGKKSCAKLGTDQTVKENLSSNRATGICRRSALSASRVAANCLALDLSQRKRANPLVGDGARRFITLSCGL